MTVPARRSPRLVTALWRLLVGFVAVLVSCGLAASLYLSTAGGRARLLHRVVLVIDRELGGGVSVQTLEHLGLASATLRGVELRARAGNPVIDIGRARAELALLPLLRGELVLSRLSLEDVTLDLRRVRDPEAGLLGSLMPERSSVEHARGAPPRVRIGALELERWHVRLPAGASSVPTDLWIDRANARLCASDPLEVEVERMAARIARGDTALGGLELSGGYRARSSARLRLSSDLGGLIAELQLDAPRLADVTDWRAIALTVRGELRELTAQRLALLSGDAALERAFLGSASVQLELGGTLQKLGAQARLTTAAGVISLAGSVRELGELELLLQTEGLRLHRLAPRLPDRVLAGEVSVSARREPRALGALELQAQASLALDGVALPPVAVGAELASDGSRRLELQTKQAGLRLSARGVAFRDGTQRLTAHSRLDVEDALRLARALRLLDPLGGRPERVEGTLDASLELDVLPSGVVRAHGSARAARLQREDLRLEQLAADVSVSGSLAEPWVQLDARWAAAHAGSVQLTPGQLRVSGGPARQSFELHAGVLPLGSVVASGALTRGARESQLALTASGELRGAPWRLDVEPMQVDERGVFLPGVRLSVAGQHASLRGRYSATTSDLTLDVAHLELARLSDSFELRPALEGVVTARVRLRGAPRRPVLDLDLDAERVGVARGVKLDAQTQMRLDGRAGLFELSGQLHESKRGSGRPARLELSLHATSEFDPRASWQKQLLDGEHRATLELTRLESALLDELLGNAQPLVYRARGSLSVDVRRGVPALHYRLNGSSRWRIDPPASARVEHGGAQVEHSAALEHTVTHELDYQAGQLRTTLELLDREGPWVALKGELGSAAGEPLLPELRRLLQDTDAVDWKGALQQASWQLELAALPRALARWPAAARLSGLDALDVGLKLVARRTGAGPSGRLDFSVDRAAKASRPDGCASRSLLSRGHVDFDGSTFRANLDVDAGPIRLASVSTHGSFDFLGLVRGERPSLPSLDVDLQANRLPLEALPLVCGHLRGELDGTAHLRARGGAPPEAQAALNVRGFSRGGEQTVDIQANATLDRALALTGSVAAREHLSRFELRLAEADNADLTNPDLPIEGSAELDHLPIAPLLTVRGPLSHTSGNLSGKLQLLSVQGRRKLSGNLQLQDVGFTLTELGQPLSDIDAELSLADDVISVKQLSGRDGNGELALDGRLTLIALDAFDAEVNLRARKFPLRQAGAIVANTTGTARIEAAWRPDRRQVRAQLRDFDIWLESAKAPHGLGLAPHPDLVVVGLATTPSGGEHASAPRPPMLIELDAGEAFWVRRADFAVKLSANLRIVVGDAHARAPESSVDVTGELRFDRGYMELIGKVFDVERGGTLRFTGGTSATLDVSARHEDHRSDRLVKVHLRGSAAAPVLEFIVDGERVSAGEALQTIYGADTVQDDGTDAEAQAKQFIGALTAGVLTTSIRRKLGAMAPIVTVDPGDGEGSSGQVRAGFELDALIPDILRNIVTGMYVEGVFTSDKAEEQGGNREVQSGVLLELHFPYNLVTSGRYGPDTTWSIDLGWQH